MPSGDFLGNARDSLLVQGLGDEDDLANALASDGLVEGAGVLDSHCSQPLGIFTEHTHQLGVVDEGWSRMTGSLRGKRRMKPGG